MNNVEMYVKSNQLQKRDTMEILCKYASKIKWKSDFVKIIDIGAGDGGVTTEILRKIIPSSHTELIGCDINENMVTFANKHHGDKRTHFFVLDIEKDIPEKLKGNYDHAFSFYTLHWINDDMKTFQNIYNLLSDGGDCLLIFLGYIPIHEIYRILSRKQKWKARLANVEAIASPYHDKQRPEAEVAQVMRQAGFKNVEVICQHRMFSFENVDALKNLLTAILPFNVPRDMLKQYLGDFVTTMNANESLGMKFDCFAEPPNVLMNYDLLIAYASKSIKS